MKVGVYVGSFDPVHNGHIKIINYLSNNYLDKIIVVPTMNYWNKKIVASLEDRINMLSNLENDKVIIDRENNNLKYTYMVMEKLEKKYMNDELYLIIGADSIVSFDKWMEYKKLLSYGLIVIDRDNIDVKYYLDKLGKDNNYISVNIENIDISSSYIRKNITNYDLIKDFIDDRVYKYICDNNLYLISPLKSMKEKDVSLKWISYLYNTKSLKYNINNVNRLKDINKHSVFDYVYRCFCILNSCDVSDLEYYYVSETLKYMDTSKCGSNDDRVLWKKKNYDLFCHNIGSASIYNEEYSDKVVYTLIYTHGLVGQYIKGEVNLDKNKPLYDLICDKYIDKETLRNVLYILNKCVIGGVNIDLYNKIKDKVNSTIDRIIDGDINEEVKIVDRINMLECGISLEEKEYINKLPNEVLKYINKLFEKEELWYYDGALKDFNLSLKIKILLYISVNLRNNVKHVTFEKMMRGLYLDYNNHIEVNIYKKRIIEKYLNDMDYFDIINNSIKENNHIKFNIKYEKDVLIFNFKFSIQARKLIDYVRCAYEADNQYKKSVYMLYDLFGFRKDEYDRFYNEINYLNRMNSSLKQKSIILDYVKGKKILDVGPGGGALLNLLEDSFSDFDIYGIDISQSVIEKLSSKKLKENRKWNIIKGDALNLKEYISECDTIIFSSIIHELFSLCTYEGKKFNYNIIKKTLESSYDVLNKGGRIIIRDGVMSENSDEKRIIKFNNPEDINILINYCNDFKGRKVTFLKISDDKVMMKVNDAMEFLYTYTWGSDSYPNEVKEQFGYFSVKEYVNFIKKCLFNVKIIEAKSFLQDGYEEHLLDKISIYDENMNVVKLPDSTCIIVIEKE